MSGLLVGVALQTPAHVLTQHGPSYIHGTYITMTGFTVDSRAQVWLMAKIDKIRLLVDSHPGNGLATLPVAGQLLHRVIFRCDDGVAAHTPFNGRNAGDGGTGRLGMAIKTLDASLNVCAVTVGQRLFRRCLEPNTGDQNRSANSDGHSQQDEYEPSNGLPTLGNQLAETQVAPSCTIEEVGPGGRKTFSSVVSCRLIGLVHLGTGGIIRPVSAAPPNHRPDTQHWLLPAYVRKVA